MASSSTNNKTKSFEEALSMTTPVRISNSNKRGKQKQSRVKQQQQKLRKTEKLATKQLRAKKTSGRGISKEEKQKMMDDADKFYKTILATLP